MLYDHLILHDTRTRCTRNEAHNSQPSLPGETLQCCIQSYVASHMLKTSYHVSTQTSACNVIYVSSKTKMTCDGIIVKYSTQSSFIQRIVQGTFGGCRTSGYARCPSDPTPCEVSALFYLSELAPKSSRVTCMFAHACCNDHLIGVVKSNTWPCHVYFESAYRTEPISDLT